MSTISDLRLFLMQCPFLQISEGSSVANVYVDYLSENPTSYEIQITPTSQIVRKYVDGGGLKQTTFVFRSIEVYEGMDIANNMDNISFYEEFSKWIEDNKPDITNWVKVEPLTDGYFFDVAEGQDKATYQIQCRILYYF